MILSRTVLYLAILDQYTLHWIHLRLTAWNTISHQAQSLLALVFRQPKYHIHHCTFHLELNDIRGTESSGLRRRIHFESKRQEGGALVLPEGGSREDLVSTHRFYPYLKKWAPYWYNMIPITNGSLFLVTGCDKVSDYAALCFPYTRPSCKKASPSISMDYIYGEDHEYSPWRKRSGDGGGIWHSPIDCEPTRGGTWPQGSQSLCVFVRGIRIALCESTWSSAIGGLSGVEKDFYTTVLQKTPPLDYATTSVLARLHRRFSETDALNELPVVRKVSPDQLFFL